jgi:hypothetical protein
MNHPILDDFNKILLTWNWSLVPPQPPALDWQLAALGALELAALRALQQVALGVLQQEVAQRPRQEAQWPALKLS